MTRATIPWNINQIVKGFKNGTLSFDNSIQRGFVWDPNRMSLLIDSVIRSYTIPPIYTIKTTEKVKTSSGTSSVYDCIDGKQRCTTFYKFLNDEFALTGLNPFIIDDETEIDLNGKKFSDLNEDIQDTIKTYSITVNFFTDITDEEVAEMMSRLNNGKVLTGTENARIKAKNLKDIIEIAKHPVLIDNMTDKAIASYANEDVVMKLVLMMNDQFELSATNVKKAYETVDVKEYAETINRIFDYANEVITFMKEFSAKFDFKKSLIKKVTTKTNLITILWAIKNVMDETDVEKFAEIIRDFFDSNNEEYNEACKNGTMRASNVQIRNMELEEFIATAKATI
jgi:hypothetical protein